MPGIEQWGFLDPRYRRCTEFYCRCFRIHVHRHTHSWLPALQVCLVSPVPSIAVLALYKWLQDAHQTLERDGSAFLQQQVLLIVRHYSAAMPSQAASRQGSLHPEEEEAPVITSPRAASSGPEATMAGPSLRADPQDLGTEAGPSSSSPRAGPSTGPDQQPSPGGRQRPAASSLPAVAARIFGPEYTDALNQEAIASMVRGFALPFRSVSCLCLYVRAASIDVEANGVDTLMRSTTGNRVSP